VRRFSGEVIPAVHRDGLYEHIVQQLNVVPDYAVRNQCTSRKQRELGPSNLNRRELFLNATSSVIFIEPVEDRDG
jgi:hypothetical protein